ncbi:MAG: hypothetical protein EOP24_42050 [Hyphomicrobiales bacterium]|nr:MAG: hypothetical protein EOP24_42050 [Hyphomicrobiales bacterium]
MKSGPPLRLLLGLSVVAVALSWLSDRQGFVSWLSAVLLNAGTGVLTSVVIIYAYDQLIARRNEKDRAEREARAIASMGRELRQHYRVLLDCYRSASDIATPPAFDDINEFLGPQYQPVVAKLDLYAPSPWDSSGSAPYYKYIEDAFARLHRELSTFLLAAGRDLSQDVFLSVHRVLNNDFMILARSLGSIYGAPIAGFGRAPSQLVTGMRASIEAYCASFAQLVTTFDRVHPQGLREYRQADWHNTVFPPGHARAA